MATPSEKQKRLQIIFLILIGFTLPCYGLGYAFVSVNRRVQPTPTRSIYLTDTPAPPDFKTNTPVQIIPTRYPTFTPSRTPSVTPTRTETSRPTDTPTPSFTPSPTSTFTVTPSPTDSPPPPASEPPPSAAP